MKSGVMVERERVAVVAPTNRSSTWESAVRRWLSRHAPAQKSDLEDVADEVFARLSRYGDDELIKSPQKFVLLVAANVVDERRGDLQSDGVAREVVVGEAREPKKAKGYALNRKLARQVKAAVEKLPERQRRMLLMHVNDGLSYQQIAQAFQMTPRLVQRDLARAYAGVRGAVGDKELDEMSL
jgi:RNA polymerase sigma factor (sigma-70 family)